MKSDRLMISLIIFVFIFYLFLPRSDAKGELPFLDTEAVISMDFKDANLKDILKIFSIQAGLNFIASESVQNRKITLYFENVPVEEAMNKIFKANNLSYELEKDSNIFIVKEWGQPEIETVTKVFYLKYATVSSSSLNQEMEDKLGICGSGSDTSSGAKESSGITKAIEKNLSKYGSIIEDSRTNSLIVTDLPSRMPIIAQTIAVLDVPVPQVMLEVEMLDVSKNIVDAMGFEFGTNPFTLILPGSFRGMQLFMGDITRRAVGMSNTSSSSGQVTFGHTYAEVLDFLRTQTDAKYLARPRILTLNNQTAEIKITTDESIGISTTTEATSGTTSASVERSETGVLLRITPQINLETGEITMFINPKVSEASQGNSFTSGGNSYQFRDPEERSTKSMIRVKDNETVILGGLIRTELAQTLTKVPFLGDIPILGALFRHKDKTRDRDRELLVFITPRIVKDGNVAFTQARKTTLPMREQSMTSAFDRQLAINTTLNNFEK